MGVPLDMPEAPGGASAVPPARVHANDEVHAAELACLQTGVFTPDLASQMFPAHKDIELLAQMQLYETSTLARSLREHFVDIVARAIEERPLDLPFEPKVFPSELSGDT